MCDRTLIVGLGNPGAQYTATRHNLGFLVVEWIAQRLGAGFGAPGLEYQVAVTRHQGRRLTLMKPRTYMNRSGTAVRAWLANREKDTAGAGGGSEAADVSGMLVVCDDLNLPLGAVRLRPGGGSGGQNGLADIISALGTEDFPRLRLGISPLAGPPDPAVWADFVLSPFAASEAAAVARMVEEAGTAALAWFEHGCEYAASRFNRRGGTPEEE